MRLKVNNTMFGETEEYEQEVILPDELAEQFEEYYFPLNDITADSFIRAIPKARRAEIYAFKDSPAFDEFIIKEIKDMISIAKE